MAFHTGYQVLASELIPGIQAVSPLVTIVIHLAVGYAEHSPLLPPSLNSLINLTLCNRVRVDANVTYCVAAPRNTPNTLTGTFFQIKISPVRD